MTDRFVALHGALRRHRAAVFAILLLAVAGAGGGLLTLPFESSLLVMLPDDGPVRRAMEFLQEAEFSDKVAISFTSEDPRVPRDVFLAELSGVLASWESPWLTSIPLEMSQAEAFDQFGFFLRQAPAILDERDWAVIEARLEPDALTAQLRRRYLQVLKPEGGFMATAIRRDPLDIQGLILDRMQRVLTTFAYGATIEQGYFVSADGRHAMRVFETPAAMADANASAALVAELVRLTALLPDGLRADIVCGHTHTVANRDAIVSDIRRMLIAATVAFFVLFLICFRDPAALWIFVVPLVAVLLALHWTGWLLGSLSSLIVGLGSVVAGIAVDYGIHVFVAVKRGRDPAQAVRIIARPVCFGALTTLSVFAAFLFSNVEGYRQLGLFSGTSLVIALGLALFVLPLALRPGRVKPVASADPLVLPVATQRRARRIRMAYGLLMAGALLLASTVEFNSDLSALDGSGSDIVDAEQRFRDVWTPDGRGQAFLAVFAPEYDEAEALNQIVADEVRGRLGVDEVLNWAMIWPAPERRREQAGRWKAFWNSRQRATVGKQLIEMGRQQGFAANAFEPFGAWIEQEPEFKHDPDDNPLFDGLRDRFAHQTDAGWFFSTWFPDTREAHRAISPLAADRDDAFVVSPSGLGDAFSVLAAREILRIAALALVLMLVSMLVVFRSVRLSLAALVPAFSGVLCMLAGMALLNHPLNVANMIAGIVVVGLCMDYGIFMACARRCRTDSGTGLAVTLSAATTVAGSGVLLFAQHPALFSIGLTLTLGVVAGYAAAMLVLPSLYRGALWTPQK